MSNSTDHEPEKPKTRFEAILYPKGNSKLGWAAYRDLHILPGKPGEISALLTEQEVAKLTESGIGMKVLREHRVKPLDVKLIVDDASSAESLRLRIASIKENGGK